MYNSLHLYYLQQLGISPWLKVKAKNPHKLLIVLNSPSNPKATNLFERLRIAIALSENEVSVVFVDEVMSDETKRHLNRLNPELVLDLGVSTEEMQRFKWACPVLKSYSPEFLLNNPLQKKVLFDAINYINQQLSTV